VQSLFLRYQWNYSDVTELRLNTQQKLLSPQLGQFGNETSSNDKTRVWTVEVTYRIAVPTGVSTVALLPVRVFLLNINNIMEFNGGM
jgi:hypothetical protein